MCSRHLHRPQHLLLQIMQKWKFGCLLVHPVGQQQLRDPDKRWVIQLSKQLRSTLSHQGWGNIRTKATQEAATSVFPQCECTRVYIEKQQENRTECVEKARKGCEESHWKKTGLKRTCDILYIWTQDFSRIFQKNLTALPAPEKLLISNIQNKYLKWNGDKCSKTWLRILRNGCGLMRSSLSALAHDTVRLTPYVRHSSCS